MLAIKTQTWYEWNGQEASETKTPTEGFLKECDKKGNTKVVMLTIKDTTHAYQTDASVLMPLELHWIENLPRRLPRPKWSLAETYLINAWLQMEFLHQIGVSTELASMESLQASLGEVRHHIADLDSKTE